MTTFPTVADLEVSFYGRVAASGGHDFVGDIGTVLSVAGTGRWVWIPDTDPEEAWMAESKGEALQALINHLKETHQ